MTLPIARRVQRVKPSPTLAVTARAARLKAEGKDVIDGYSIVGGKLFVSRLHDVKTETTLYTLDGKETAVADLLKKAGANEPAAALQVDPKVLESYVGTYKTESFPLDIKVSVKEGKLVMQATGQPEFVPKPKSPTVFEFAPANISIEFDSASSFTLKQGGMNLKFKKG